MPMALQRRNGRSLPPRRAELAIARPVLCRHHVMVDEDDLAAHGAVRRCAERVDAIEVSNLAGNPVRSGRPAVAERGDDQLLREGGDDLRALRPTRPHRHGEGFDMDVGEAHRAQALHGPVTRPRLGLGRGKPLPDFGGQPFGDVPGIMVVIEDIVAQRGNRRVGDHGRRQRRGGLLREGRGGAGEEDGGEGRSVHENATTERRAVSHQRRSIKFARRSIKEASSGRPQAAGTGRYGAGTWPAAGHISSTRSRTGCGEDRPTGLARASG